MAYEEGYYGRLAAFNLDRVFRTSKMTRQEFAEATGVSRTTMISYDSGRAFPTLSSLEKVANAFNIPFVDFFRNMDGLIDGVTEGFGSATMIGTDEKPVSFMQKLMQHVTVKNKTEFSLRVKSGHMEPFAHPGDLVVCRFVGKAEDGKTHLIVYDNKIIPAKAQQYRDGYLTKFTPLCEGVEPFKTVDNVSDASVLGVITSVIHSLE